MTDSGFIEATHTPDSASPYRSGCGHRKSREYLRPSPSRCSGHLMTCTLEFDADLEKKAEEKYFSRTQYTCRYSGRAGCSYIGALADAVSSSGIACHEPYQRRWNSLRLITGWLIRFRWTYRVVRFMVRKKKKIRFLMPLYSSIEMTTAYVCSIRDVYCLIDLLGACLRPLRVKALREPQ